MKRHSLITMEEILEWSIEFNVPTQQVVCGYLRNPRGRKEYNKIWGYCSLFQKKCSYRIPLVQCDREQEWLKNKKFNKYKKKEKIEVKFPKEWRK